MPIRTTTESSCSSQQSDTVAIETILEELRAKNAARRIKKREQLENEYEKQKESLKNDFEKQMEEKLAKFVQDMDELPVRINTLLQRRANILSRLKEIDDEMKNRKQECFAQMKTAMKGAGLPEN
ncbi:hypothetical protein SJAG_05333 [Schizosaccharomyces japonicus yFS275]|uniref:Uncharacterized protein n=1 Tax=Schizosaccharomyces japonicus (strain yFS275 / FY16936) TaxID=402676 RepID=B6K733_SCHJY|nr:hypothetical protein SJAG_05333 [Schizosaccharomyces japonicus yFS275]EEB09337.1 hypothetical protein SJAG_05333 [Schizosaccharomyces japonicus yFS275]